MKQNFLFLLSIIPLQVFAQKADNSYECIYEYTVKTTNAENETYTTILQFDDIHARFADYAAFQLDSLMQTGKATEEQLKKAEEGVVKTAFYFDQTTFVNASERTITVYSVIPPNLYSYQEATNGIAWQLTDETDTICGYLCNKATGEYGGRIWNAWFSSEISSSFGPWKLGGLPGLIMYACDTENIHHFKAITFRQGTTPITAPRIPNSIATSREKFIKAKNHFEENPIANIPTESITDMRVEKGDGGSNSIFINGVQVRLRTNGYVPLEIK